MITWDLYNTIVARATYIDYKDSIVVSASEFHVNYMGSTTFIVCTGELMNNSDVTWEHLRFEVQYFNESGELIDTISDKNYSLTLPPHDRVTFRVMDKAGRPAHQYATHKVYVKWAEEFK
jgi:hypothetical protein